MTKVAIEESLDPLEQLHQAQADKLGLTREEYAALSKTVKPEDTVDEAMILPHMLKSKG